MKSADIEMVNLYQESSILQLVPCLLYPGTKTALEFSLAAHIEGHVVHCHC